MRECIIQHLNYRESYKIRNAPARFGEAYNDARAHGSASYAEAILLHRLQKIEIHPSNVKISPLTFHLSQLFTAQ